MCQQKVFSSLQTLVRTSKRKSLLEIVELCFGLQLHITKPGGIMYKWVLFRIIRLLSVLERLPDSYDRRILGFTSLSAYCCSSASYAQPAKTFISATVLRPEQRNQDLPAQLQAPSPALRAAAFTRNSKTSW